MLLMENRSKMSSKSGDSSGSDSLFGDNPYDAVDCLGLKEPPKLTAFEMKMKRTFTFDRNKYKEFPDLQICKFIKFKVSKDIRT